MKPNIVLPTSFVALSLLAAAACSAAQPEAGSGKVEVRWTKYGVPHVKAHTYKDLGFGYGYAVAGERLCSMSDHFVTIRGERSKWYGAEGRAMVGFLPTSNIDSDLFYRVQLSDELVERAAGELQPETRDLIGGYVAGLNKYISEMSETERRSVCDGQPIPTLTEADVVRGELAIGATKKAFHIAPYTTSSTVAWQGADSDGQAVVTAPVLAALEVYKKLEKGQGSNVWAYGADVLQGGGAMVLANPHSPWVYRHWHSFNVLHLTIPGELDVAGATFSGMPVPMIGFTKDVSWSMTGAHTWYVLQVMQVTESADSPTYVMDGENKPLRTEQVVIDVLEDDGTLAQRTFNVPVSELGPVYKLPALPAQGRPAGWYAVTAPSDGNAKAFDQYLAVARARNVAELAVAVENNRGRGVHVTAGDRFGNLAFVESGAALDFSDDELHVCHYSDSTAAFNVIDGSRKACSAQGADGKPKLAPKELYPTARTRRVIQNTNNSYKYTVYGEVLPDHRILFGDQDPIVRPLLSGNSSARERDRNMRILMSTRRMSEITADGLVTPDEAMQVLFDDRNFVAETWLDDLLTVCKATSVSDTVREGCDVLASWDRTNNADSRGALLFHQMWLKISRIASFLPSSQSADPYTQEPLSMTQQKGALVLKAIEDSVTELKALGFAADEVWSNVLYAETPDGKLPLHGGSMRQGVLNAMDVLPLTEKGFASITVGGAYMHLVRWVDGQLIADVLLAYGPTEELSSPDRTEQIKLFSQKRFYRFPFREAELNDGEIVRSLTLSLDAD